VDRKVKRPVKRFMSRLHG